MRLRLASLLILAVAVSPRIASAQSPQLPSEAVAPAHVAYVEGAATLERDGRPETAPLNMPLLSGDRLKTLNGRVEVLFGDGSALHMDAQTTIDVQSDDLMRLIDGRLRLTLLGSADSAQAQSVRIVYRVDSPAGSVRVTQPGEYRVAILRRGEETQMELAVLRGSGEIFTDEGATPVRAGERAYASAGLTPSYAYAFNSASWDAFDRWSESRRDTRLGQSTQYLPSEVRAYASTFDEDGDWRYMQTYGYVWYPRVAVSWRPYYYGRWAHYPRYGWTWIGADRFAWATHHYGRWGFSAGAWFWIPAPRWAPAYVSWAYAPGYVSWCPLGFDNRPVIGVNIFNVGPGYYSSWHAWTAVGYTSFGRGYVHHRAVNWDRYDRGHRPAFHVRQTAPVYRDVAVPRSAPIRWAGSRTVNDAQAVTTGAGTRAALSGNRTPRSSTPTVPAAGGISATTGALPSGARAPRYINRGDEIVRSQSGRPSGPVRSAPSADTAVPAPGNGGRRTAPAGPALRLDTPADSPAADRTRVGRDGGPGYGPRTPYERGSVTPRADAPAYQPPMRSAEPYDRGSVAPRTDAPAYRPPMRSSEPYDRGRAVPRTTPPEPGAPPREAAPSPAPDAGPRGYAQPRGFESRPSPAAGAGERQAPAPAPRATPAPERSAPSGGGGVAVPRAPSSPGSAAPAPAGGGSGARAPRGRGGV